MTFAPAEMGACGAGNFSSLVGGAAAWPLVTHAQEVERVRRIGVDEAIE
jgi:hypothetical protein